MFTGLVQSVGRVAGVARKGTRVRLSVDPGEWEHVPAAGDSISVSGCCLTVANVSKGRKRVLEFDVVAESLDKTRLGALRVGDGVNLEHAATPTTLMGGHLVQGHVDGVGRVARVKEGDDWRVWVALPAGKGRDEDLAEYLVPKGSVCVDGVSLTVAGLWSGKVGGVGDKKDRGFSVALIPTTLEGTTLKGLKVGDPVNLEMDLIAKTVVQWVKKFGGVSGGNGGLRRQVRRGSRKGR